MKADLLYEVGNTRIKRGQVGPDGTLTADIIDPKWFDSDGPPRGPSTAVVAGSHPDRLRQLVDRLQTWCDVTVVTSYHQLPVTVAVENPETVGIDRLLGAVAANRRRTAGRAAVTVDVGTAATVNLVDIDGVFRGGLILPGPTTMAKSLHTDTAKLPQLDTLKPFPEHLFPAHPTANAINAGIVYAIGGAVTLALDHATTNGIVPQLLLTGGGSHLVAGLLKRFVPQVVPALNLEGLRITAEALP